MKKAVFLGVWIVLIVLTIIVAIVSGSSLKHSFSIILILSVIKFWLISYYFMELRKAHVFWKSSVLVFLFLFSVLSLLLI